jgi:hypothetical protein
MRFTYLLALAAASALAACGSASGKGQCSTPGAIECVSNTLSRVCAADGTWVTEQCSNDQTCMGTGGCVLATDISCNVTDNGCVDSSHAVVCNSDGKGFQSVTCPTGTTCSGFGTCIGTCMVGASSCNGAYTVQTCTDGFTVTDTSCQPGTTSCVTTSAGNAPIHTAACKPAGCVDNGPTCGNKASDPTSTDPNFTSTCVGSPGGTHWQSEQCAVPGSCAEGAGCVQDCTPGAKRCNGLGTQDCNAQSQWGTITACQPTATGIDQVCLTPSGAAAPVCGDRVCAAAPGACAADGFHACVNGKVSASGAPCATGVCVGSTNYDGYIAGSCQPQCNPGDTRCISNEAYEACDANHRWSSTVNQCPANGTDKCIGYSDNSTGASKSICGACVPGTHRCTNSAGTGAGTYIETCDTTGHYGSPAQCAMGQCQASLNDNACVMQCVPNSTICLGTAPASPPNPSHPGSVNWGSCDAAGNLPTSGGTACAGGTSCRKHSNGQAAGTGAAACVVCVGSDNESGFVDTRCITTAAPNSVETCTAGNVWNTPTVCASTAPYAGLCRSEPGPTCGQGYEEPYCSRAYLLANGYPNGCAAYTGYSDTTIAWGATADCCVNPYCAGNYGGGFDAPAACY